MAFLRHGQRIMQGRAPTQGNPNWIVPKRISGHTQEALDALENIPNATPAEKEAVANFVDTLVRKGIWPLMDEIGVMALSNETDSLTGIVAGTLATAQANASHIGSTGWATTTDDDTFTKTGLVDTNWNVDAHDPRTNNLSFSTYLQFSAPLNGASTFGSYESSARQSRFGTDTLLNPWLQIQGPTATRAIDTTGSVSSNTHLLGSRDAADDVRIYRDGDLRALNDVTATGDTTDANLFVGGASAEVSFIITANITSFWHVGQSLTAAQSGDLYDAMITMLQAIGVPGA